MLLSAPSRNRPLHLDGASMRGTSWVLIVVLLSLLSPADGEAQRDKTPPSGGIVVRPSCQLGCIGASPVSVTPAGQPDTVIVTSNPAANQTVLFTVTNVG